MQIRPSRRYGPLARRYTVAVWLTVERMLGMRRAMLNLRPPSEYAPCHLAEGSFSPRNPTLG